MGDVIALHEIQNASLIASRVASWIRNNLSTSNAVPISVEAITADAARLDSLLLMFRNRLHPRHAASVSRQARGFVLVGNEVCAGPSGGALFTFTLSHDGRSLGSLVLPYSSVAGLLEALGLESANWVARLFPWLPARPAEEFLPTAPAGGVGGPGGSVILSEDALAPTLCSACHVVAACPGSTLCAACVTRRSRWVESQEAVARQNAAVAPTTPASPEAPAQEVARG